MALLMRETGLTTKSQVTESSNKRVHLKLTTDSGRKVSRKDLEFIFTKMGRFTQDFSKKTKRKVMVYIIGQTVGDMKGGGMIINSMD